MIQAKGNQRIVGKTKDDSGLSGKIPAICVSHCWQIN
jgi:hypothetical protein